MNGIKWLLDTNMVIGLLKKRPAAIALAEAQNLEMNQAAVSQITRMELLGFPGIASGEETSIHAFLRNCHILLIDEAIENAAIQLRRSKACKLPDAIIAATAQVHQIILLTLDQHLDKESKTP